MGGWVGVMALLIAGASLLNRAQRPGRQLPEFPCGHSR